VLLWQARMPLMLQLPAWGSESLFSNSLFFQAEPINWAYALALTTLGLATILTAVVRPNFPAVFPWAGILALTGFGILAVLADNPLTLVLIWAGLDIVELITQLVSVKGESSSQRVVTGFGVRALGIGLLLWAGLTSLWSGVPLDFRSPLPDASLYMILAAALRLGVLPLHLAYGTETQTRRGFGTVLRLVSAASSLVILARIPAQEIASPFAPFVLVLVAVAGLYGAWMWVRSPDELAGRPYWIIALAALAVAAALRGNPAGSVAWGVALVLTGGALFLFSVQHRILQRILLVAGIWGISSLPFSPTATGWESAVAPSWFSWISWALLVAVQAMLAAGFIRHTLWQSSATPLDAHLAWARNIHPLGILLPLGTLILLGLYGWEGALIIGNIPAAAAAVVLTILIIWLMPRSRWLSPIRAHWVRPAGSAPTRLDALNNTLTGFYITLGRLTKNFADMLEGGGGILWALLFLVLYLSLLGPKAP
jgi:hypothetical protein